MNRDDISLWFLRIGLASVFLYAAVGSFLQPLNWIGYFPDTLRHLIPQSLLLTGFSFYELALALWLLSSWRTFFAASLAAFTLFGILVTNFGILDITFRDIGLFFAALALASTTKPHFSSKKA